MGRSIAASSSTSAQGSTAARGVEERAGPRAAPSSSGSSGGATASLDGFNSLESQALTLPYLVPALDSLPWIQRNRRIFYVGAWIGSFLDGQTSDSAQVAVRAFLEQRDDLPLDLRRKVLQAADELERTVRIRRAFSVAAPTS